MSSPADFGDGQADGVEVPFDRVGKFVRQLSHDVRNNLGSMDLQAAYAAELVSDPEAAEELRKLRGMITNTAKMLQAVSGQYWVPKLNELTLPAHMLVEDFRDRLGKQHPEIASAIEWNVQLGEECVSVDLELIFGALVELCRNAFHFREPNTKITAVARAAERHFVLELRQRRTKVDALPETWGLAPLVSTRRGGYGLGLFHARQILGALGAELELSHDAAAAVVTTRVRIALVPAPAG